MDKVKIAVCGASGKMGRALIGCIRDDDALTLVGALEIGRAHVRTPVTEKSRMPSSA